MKKYIFLIVAILTLGACQNKSPEEPSLAIQWELVDNLVNENGQSLWEISVKNNSGKTLNNTGWNLYFNHIIGLETDYESGLSIEHVNGDLRVIKPTHDFMALADGSSMIFKIYASASALSFTDAPMGFYLVFDENQEQAIECYLKVKKITTKNLKRTSDELLPIHDAAVTFEENKNITELKTGEYCPIIPTPVKFEQGAESIILKDKISIAFDPAFENEAQFAQHKISALFTGEVAKLVGDHADIIIKKSTALQPEAYQLNINDNGITINAGSNSGAFYGVQSLLALIPVESWKSAQAELALNYVTISDEPRFEYRGIFLDVARNFQPKENVLKVLDAMAFYKLNKFHFHICDDEGWRVEIKDLPELTNFGSYRGYSPNESKYLYPSFGSGPESSPEVSHGSGFYSREDFMDILKYATERHIEVIPEIDMPGHARAAIRSMEVRYDKYMAQGEEAKAKEYLLRDLSDKSEYKSVQGWTDNVIDVSMESSYHFLEKITDEMIALFNEAGAPLTTIHTGGDEVPHGVWTASPACNEFMDKNSKYNSPTDMAQYFVHRFSTLLSERNLIAAGWEEIALFHEGDKRPNPDFIGKNLQPTVWNNMWNSGAEDVGYQLANAGYPIVLAHVTNFYFDLAYHKNPEEPGYYWGNFINTKHPWEYTPFDITKCAEQDRFGNPIDRKTIQDNTIKLSTKGKANVMGIQGLLWSENNLGSERMEYFFFPKMLGLAERAWADQPEWATIEDDAKRASLKDKAWNEFCNTVGHYDLARLDYMNGGYNYRVPSIGIKEIDGKNHKNIRFPGLKTE